MAAKGVQKCNSFELIQKPAKDWDIYQKCQKPDLSPDPDSSSSRRISKRQSSDFACSSLPVFDLAYCPLRVKSINRLKRNKCCCLVGFKIVLKDNYMIKFPASANNQWDLCWQ